MLESLLNYILAFFSGILHMNLKDPHDIPFALPLVTASVTGFIIGFTILRFIGNEERERQLNQNPESKR